MTIPLILCGLVFGPGFLGTFDICILSGLRASSHQNNQCVAIAPEVNSVAGSKVNSSLQDSPSDGHVIAEVTRLHSLEGGNDLRGGLIIEVL